jgi:predicted nucleic acid-binding protein
MVGCLVFLIDTNVWIEVLLEQEKSPQVKVFFEAVDADQLAISEFSIYSIGIILTRLKKDEVFRDFLSDTIEDSGITVVRLDAAGLMQALTLRREFQLDFDDAYQYAAAVHHGLTLISFDADFDGTKLGRSTPSQALSH